jgi:Methyltransferase domain
LTATATLPPPLDPTALGAIAENGYLLSFDDGIYSDLDVGLTLDYMRRRFVVPMSRHVEIERATLLDCAAGFGWLSFAYLLAGGGRAILADLDAERLAAARDIARNLGLLERCEFRVAAMAEAAGPDSVDIFASVETLEHVGREHIAASVRGLARAARQAVILTTPNALFPIVAHDTALPFAHWLPAGFRRRYAAMAGRAGGDRGNQFLRPWDLAPLTAKFRPVSTYQTFESLGEFDDFFPHYLPYGPDDCQRRRARPKRGQRLLQIGLASLLGRYSFALAPNLASVWVRRHK